MSQLLALFGFFALVLVAVYWVNRAVRLFDRLIADGQSAWVFLEFTALTLPYVIRLVLPVAAFVATVYVTNRLSRDSELVVMQATGFSPWRLARPVAYFGLVVAALMTVVMLFTIDCLPNAMLNPLFVVMLGGLTACTAPGALGVPMVPARPVRAALQFA